MRFPKDGLPHKSVIEWWYFNGHLYDKKGNKYAFMSCLFKTDPKKTSIPLVEKIPTREVYFSHSLLSDINKKKVVAHTNPISILSKDSLTKKRLFINYLNPSVTGYVNNEISEIELFKYRVKNEDFDLILKSRKRPLMHNGKGFFIVKRKKVHYYSLTDMDVEGIVRLNGKSIEVKGKAWMDHEWASFPGEKKWNWFSIQLDDGMELMIQDYNNQENVYVGIMHKNQKTEFADDLVLMPMKEWKSRLTGARYPIEWKILVPSKNIELNVTALLKNQEVIFGSLNYWEGPTSISGKINEKKVRGNGFMELAGRKVEKSKIGIYKHQIKEETAFYLKFARREASHLLKNYLRK